MAETVLITGGAGFVGSHIGIHLKEANPGLRVIAFDNLKRRGSELNLARLKKAGVEFVHGDVRSTEDLAFLPKIHRLYDCSAEPSALAGYGENPGYILETNLVGTLNCLELARRHGAMFVFLSTSRIYPHTAISRLRFAENPTRFTLESDAGIRGVSAAGISEGFPLDGARTLYGATKLASEIVVTEYFEMYRLPGFINRCSVLTGPWQMGKVDQGFMVYWVANHLLGKPLKYLGYGGKGKQVRDVLHIRDLCGLLDIQVNNLKTHQGRIYNVGGGQDGSFSLAELTEVCQRETGKRVPIEGDSTERPGDVCWYVTDAGLIRQVAGWKPTVSREAIVQELIRWVSDHRDVLAPIFG